jgi:hypothetical protein
MKDLPVLRVEQEAIDLAESMVAEGLLAEKAAIDALHMTMATVHRMEVLLTWNCRHLANSQILAEVGRWIRIKGYELPLVCTPLELMGGEENEP